MDKNPPTDKCHTITIVTFKVTTRLNLSSKDSISSRKINIKITAKKSQEEEDKKKSSTEPSESSIEKELFQKVAL